MVDYVSNKGSPLVEKLLVERITHRLIPFHFCSEGFGIHFDSFGDVFSLAKPVVRVPKISLATMNDSVKISGSLISLKGLNLIMGHPEIVDKDICRCANTRIFKNERHDFPFHPDDIWIKWDHSGLAVGKLSHKFFDRQRLHINSLQKNWLSGPSTFKARFGNLQRIVSFLNRDIRGLSSSGARNEVTKLHEEWIISWEVMLLKF